jgi:hypothetical protein
MIYHVFILENARGSHRSVLLAFFQSYVKHNLRKNKIVVPPSLVFLGISTKIKALEPN